MHLKSSLFLLCVLLCNPVFGNENIKVPSVSTPSVEKNVTDISKQEAYAKEPYFVPYMTDLQKAISKHWNPSHYPESNRTVVLFKVHKNGEITDIKVKSTNNLTTSEAAIEALTKSSPVKPLPKEFKGESVDVLFTFDYNVHKLPYVNEQKYRVVNGTVKNPGNIDWSSYIKSVEDKTKLFWGPPKDAPSEIIIVDFSIDKMGDVSDITVLQGKGESAKAAVNAILDASPFMILPLELNKINVHFVFDYEKRTYDRSFENYAGNKVSYSNGGISKGVKYLTDEMSKEPPRPAFMVKQHKASEGYKIAVIKILKEQLPAAYTCIEREMSFSLTLTNLGKVKNVVIVNSSGSDRYDNTVVKKIKNMKFPAFPQGMQGDEYSIYYKFQKRVDPLKSYPVIPIFIPI